MARPSHTLELTEVEDTLRRLLTDVAQYINPASPSELRYTGGWVRDKLLGIGSHDIDVAINDMTGYQFGLKMKEYLEIADNAKKYGIQGVSDKDGASSKVVSGLHKIEANPEKSKHLETVTTRVFGLDIDLVNLRKETYTEDSRTPQMEFGTPEEDALRRDATINAMFYNLQTQKIEDLTGRGFDDMKSKIIRTPLEPYQTFKDDPLRVLRLIRFASRLGYALEEQAAAAMQDPSIRDALRAKISRERVGTEYEKMIKGPDPLRALRLISDNNLYDTIFVDPTTNHQYQPAASDWPATCELSQALIKGKEPKIKDILLPDKEHEYLLWVLSSIVPWASAPIPEPKGRNKKRPPPVAACVVREGIKAPNKVCDVVAQAVLNFEDIETTITGFARESTLLTSPRKLCKYLQRDTLGMSIRRWGPTWRSQVALHLLVDAQGSASVQDTLDQHSAFLSKIDELGLLEAYAMKPLVDGKTLSDAMDLKPGPWMKDALDVVMEWQLRNPSLTSPDDVIKALQRGQDDGELRRPMASLFLRLIGGFLTKQTVFHWSQSCPVEKTRVGFEQPTSAGKGAGRYDGPLGLMKWCSNHAMTMDLKHALPSIFDPLKSIIEDDGQDAVDRGAALRLVSWMLRLTPPACWTKNQYAHEIKRMLFGATTCLPPLTPVDDANTILGPAYESLIVWTRVTRASTQQHRDSQAPLFDPLRHWPRPELYDDLFQDFARHMRIIVYEHLFANLQMLRDRFPETQEVLLSQLLRIVDEILVHFEYRDADVLLDQLNQLVLSRPLIAGTCPALITRAAQVVKSLLHHHNLNWESSVPLLLSGMSFSWVDLELECDRARGDDYLAAHVTELEAAKNELFECASMLQDESGDQQAREEYRDGIKELVQAEPLLRGLYDP